jgi:8-oxo-dGTP pyrophosphatase MutT (NUDIX family)
MTNSSDPANLADMIREISAGGVVLLNRPEGWAVAVIEPQGESSGSSSAARKSSQKVRLALPKGLLDPGETPEQTAIREVREETGITGAPIAKLGDIKYVYVRSWGDKERVFKIVSFYLLLYQSGEIDDIPASMRVEVKRALWIPLEEAAGKLAYRGERDMILRALEYAKASPTA